MKTLYTHGQVQKHGLKIFDMYYDNPTIFMFLSSAQLTYFKIGGGGGGRGVVLSADTWEKKFSINELFVKFFISHSLSCHFWELVRGGGGGGGGSYSHIVWVGVCR